jgi:hypothetical protein
MTKKISFDMFDKALDLYFFANFMIEKYAD